MKFLKFLLFLVLIVLIGGAIYFATQDGTYQIEESTVIEAPKSVVYDIANDYKTWENWGPWKAEDPTMVWTYSDKTSGEGASYSWQGEYDGSMTTTKAVPHTTLEQDLTIVTPGGERYPKVYWNFEDTENGGTKATWGMTGEHTIMDKAYFAFSGMDFEAEQREMYTKGLSGLKKMAEEAITAYEINVDGLAEHGGGFYLYRTTSANAASISQTMGENYGGIMAFMNSNNIKQSGMPFTIYNQMLENGAVIMTNAIPVKEKIVVAGETNVLSGFMPRTAALKVTLRGDYKNLDKAWAKAYEAVAEKGHEQSDQPPFEIYTNDPGEFPNPADWVTEIYVPIVDIQ